MSRARIRCGTRPDGAAPTPPAPAPTHPGAAYPDRRTPGITITAAASDESEADARCSGCGVRPARPPYEAGEGEIAPWHLWGLTASGATTDSLQAVARWICDRCFSARRPSSPA